MASVVATSRDAYLPSPPKRSQSIQELETDVSKALPNECGAAQHFLAEISKNPSAEETRGVKNMQEEHAMKPPPLAEVQQIEAPAAENLPKSIKSEPDLITALHLSNTKPPEMEIVEFAERKKVSPAASMELSNDESDSELSASLLDTGSSFEFVKEAVMLPEEKEMNVQTQLLDAEKAICEFDLQKAGEAISDFKEKLTAEESEIGYVLGELEKTKGWIQLCKGDGLFVPVSSESSCCAKQPEELSRLSMAEGNTVDVSHEVEQAEKEVERNLKRLSELNSLKQSALEDCEAAVCTQANELMRVKELLQKHGLLREFLTGLMTVLAETEADISLLRSIPKFELKSSLGVKYMEMTPRIGSETKLESALRDKDLSMEKLMQELSTIRGVKMDESGAELVTAEVRLEQAKIVEGKRLVALGSSLEQMDETKINLKKAMDEGLSLATKINDLQAEISKHQAELESAHETDQIACATLASLQDELCSIRTKKLSAQASEAKAKEAKKSLPAAIKQLASEADKAKVASNVSREEARKGKLEIEQANASMGTTLKRLQAVQKEAEVAGASQAIALAELKALSVPEGESLKEMAICISFKEYHTLRDTGLKSEVFAMKKVADILVQVDAATASKQEAQGKLDAIFKELDVMVKALEEAQKKADNAQAAKLLVEAELRKWRAEHDQLRRTGSNVSSVSTSAAQSPRFTNGTGDQGKLVPQSFYHKKALTNLDGFTEFLALKVPTSEKAVNVISEMDFPQKAGKAKKLSLFTRMVSMILRKETKLVK